MWLAMETGSSGYTGGERTVEAKGDAREYIEGLCWIGSGEQHDSGIQVK